MFASECIVKVRGQPQVLSSTLFEAGSLVVLCTSSQVVCRFPGILLSFCRWLGLQLHVAAIELSRFWGSELDSSYFMASTLLTEVPPQPLPLIFNFNSNIKTIFRIIQRVPFYFLCISINMSVVHFIMNEICELLNFAYGQNQMLLLCIPEAQQISRGTEFILSSDLQQFRTCHHIMIHIFLMHRKLPKNSDIINLNCFDKY